MISRWMVRVTCCVALLGFVQVARAQEFSADVFSTKAENMQLKKLYAGKNKVRFEVDNGSGGMGPVAVIADEAQNKFVVLMTARQMYMDAPAMMTKPLITKFWRVQDVNDACPGWKKAAEQAGTDKNWGSCTKIGSDTVNGRSTVQYEGVSNKGEKNHVWVDTKLHCVVKTEGEGGGIELRNIKEGSQPDSLFEVPASYTKFDMGMMKQR